MDPRAGRQVWNAEHEDAVRALRRRLRRSLALTGLLGFAGFIGASLLVASWLPHGSFLLAALIVLAVPVVVLGLLAAAAVWVGRRAWRSGAWLEVIPAAAGMPGPGRVRWLLRALLAGRGLWRLTRRARHPRRSRPVYAQYQAGSGEPWHQARVGDLRGTNR